MTWQFVVLILFLHWVFDFVFQTDYMARNKSKSVKALASHVAIYSLWGLLIGLTFTKGLLLVGFLFITHFVIDFITSKINTKLWQAQKVHWFFVSVGFDQFLHYVTILWFISYLLG